MANKFIPISEPSITQKEIDYVMKAVKSGWVSSLGEYLIMFEKKFADYIGVKYALTVSNATVGLHLALVCLGLKAGDEVIVPDLTFVATANAVAYTGAKPVFADIDRETWCLDPQKVRKAITVKTKAIIPVHLYGFPAEMDEINKIAGENNLFVIEDAAEAHGAEYKGKKVGSIGNCGVFSFYGNKIMTTGEGGIITTNDKNLYQKAIYLRDHAMSKKKKYWHTEIGYNYRMTNIQAALGLAQLERIKKLIEKKKQIFSWYKKYLGNMEWLTFNPEKAWAKNVYWMTCILLSKKTHISRDNLIRELKRENIDSRPFFYPISRMPMYRTKNPNSVADDFSKRGINLPSGVNLTEDEVLLISNIIRKKLCP